MYIYLYISNYPSIYLSIYLSIYGLSITYPGVPADLAGPSLAHALHVALVVFDVAEGVGDHLDR